MTLRQSLSLIHTQASMKLRSQANTLLLSYIWWILEPFLYVCLFYFVFKYLLNRGGDDFFIFMIIAKIPFLWFQKGVASASNSIVENKGLILQRIMPKQIFPMVHVQETFYKQIVAFAVMLCIVVFSGYYYFEFWWQAILLIILQYILICGVSFIFAVFVTYVPDFRVLIQMFLMGLMFSSGIFWDINDISDPTIKNFILTYNPMAVLLDGYRQVFMYGKLLNWNTLIPVIIITLSIFVIGFLAVQALNNKLTRRLLM